MLKIEMTITSVERRDRSTPVTDESVSSDIFFVVDCNAKQTTIEVGNVEVEGFVPLRIETSLLDLGLLFG